MGLADEAFENLPTELGWALTEYYRVDSLSNYDQLVRALGYFTHRYGKIDRLDSLNEFWLETEAQLRTDFNIFGIKTNDIMKIKRKSEMKRSSSKWVWMWLRVENLKMKRKLLNLQNRLAIRWWPSLILVWAPMQLTKFTMT